MDTKFIKAVCKKTGRKYGLEIKQINGSWKVVNMIDLSDSEATLISSEVRQDSFETYVNLLACPFCGSRKVGSCSCAQKRISCTKNMKYQYNCIYCNELKIDYSIPTYSEVLGRVGESVTLSQGQEVKIRYSDDRPLNQIYVGVGWDPSRSDNNIDVDSSVVVMSGQGRETDLVYYHDLSHPSGCVIHHGDNLTGIGTDNADDENITVYLSKVPANRDKLVFVLNIYECVYRNQTFGDIENLYIRLYDPDSKKVLVEYKVEGNYKDDTALIIGMAYLKNGSWFFKAIGKGSSAKNVHQLERECVEICG